MHFEQLNVARRLPPMEKHEARRRKGHTSVGVQRRCYTGRGFVTVGATGRYHIWKLGTGLPLGSPQARVSRGGHRLSPRVEDSPLLGAPGVPGERSTSWTCRATIVTRRYIALCSPPFGHARATRALRAAFQNDLPRGLEAHALLKGRSLSRGGSGTRPAFSLL